MLWAEGRAAPEFLAELPQEVQSAWADSFGMCMEKEGATEMACAHYAWYEIVKALMPAEEEAQMGEALRTYASNLRAALAKTAGAGKIQG